MDGDRALSFEPDEKVFKEHSPFGGPSPLLRVAAAKTSEKDEEPSEEPVDADAEVYDLAALWLALGDSLPPAAMSELEAKMSNTHSLEAIRELITGAMKQHNFVPDVGAATASLHMEERTEDPTAKVKAAGRAHEEAGRQLEQLLSKKEEGAEDVAEATIQAATDAKVEAQEALQEAKEQLAKYLEEAKEWKQRYVRLPVRPWRLEPLEGAKLFPALAGLRSSCSRYPVILAMARMLFLVLPCLVAAEPQSLRGSDVPRKLFDEVACTGSGGLSQDAPSCYGGQVLVESFSLHVLSYDGSTGIVDMKAEGPQTAECEGAEFQNDDNAITIENDHGCGLANYEYSVRYCPDQDHVIINLVKPYDMRVVLQSRTCPGAGE
ncbi:unnamed protein product, partial [Symbiodinium necroappetens]